VLEPPQWRELAARLRAHAVEWVIEPTTLFILDPSGNALEFKSFADLAQLFAR
jgi:extradiol dioxygenase family protein